MSAGNTEQQPYRLDFTAPARRELDRLPEVAVAALLELLVAIEGNPHRLGSRLLRPPYEGTWRARRGEYRVLYEIDDEARTVLVTAVRHRRDAYRS